MARCKNCDRLVSDQFCSHCGQKLQLERITFAFLWHEIFHFFTHIQHGFLYTSWKMLQHPGKTVIAYIEGKRKSHQPPISYFLIWTTIFILTLYFLVTVFGENQVIDYKDYFGPGASTAFAISNLSIILTIIIPFQALYLYILITRNKYNYFETLTIMIYVIGSISMLQFVFAVLALLYYTITSQPVDLHISDIFKAGFFMWFIYCFLKVFTTRHKIVKGILFILLAAGTFSLWPIFGVPFVSGFFIE